MVDDPLQQLSRVAGLTAYVLLWLNMCLGVGLKSALPLPFLKRWRIADLHQFVALLSLGFLGLHIAVLVGLKQRPFSLAELWVPQLRSVEATLGITALYFSLLVLATSYLRRHLNLLVWRSVHGLSFVAYALGVAHAVMAGPDGDAWWAGFMYWSTNTVLLALVGRRIWRVRENTARSCPGVVLDTTPRLNRG
jgi:sulfoxide reductase heme-binding subunit YedZ